MIPSGRHLPREFLSPALQNQQGPEIWGVVTGAALMLPPPESDHILVIEAPNEGVFSKNALLKCPLQRTPEPLRQRNRKTHFWARERSIREQVSERLFEDVFAFPMP